MGRLEEEIIDSILSRYLLIYSVDLENDYMEVVYETEKYGTFGMERSGRYSELNSKYSQARVDLEFSKWREDVGSIDNLLFKSAHISPRFPLVTGITVLPINVCFHNCPPAVQTDPGSTAIWAGVSPY